MRAIVQRVSRACVHVEGEAVGKINQGLCVLLGLHVEDTEEDAEYIARKVLGVRLFQGEDGKQWNKSVRDIDGEILVGNKPDFHYAMPPGPAREAFARFVDRLRNDLGESKVATGSFGAMMDVELVNDGPVTLDIDSRNRGGSGKAAAKGGET